MDEGLEIGLIILSVIVVLVIMLAIFASTQDYRSDKRKSSNKVEKEEHQIDTYDEDKEKDEEKEKTNVIERPQTIRPSRPTIESEPIPYTDILGSEGEDEVDRILRKVQKINGGEVYKNIILVDEYNNYTEIDNIYVSEYGIFIIETKNWTGSISGNRYDEKWHILDDYDNVIKTYENPFKQNDRHITFFERVFRVSCEITPIVVFISDAADYVECEDVVMSDDLNNYLLKFEYPELDDNDYDYVVGKLNRFKNNPPMTHEQYKNNVRNRYKNR